MTDFAPAARDAIEALELTAGPSRAIAAIDPAKRLTRSPERRRIVLISDGCFEGAETLDGQSGVDLVMVGETANNPAITALSVRRSLVDPVAYAALIEAEYFGDDATPLLVEAGGATLMASLVRGDDRLVVLAADLDSSDLPLRIAFPVLMTKAVNWFLGQTGELQPSLGTGTLAEVEIDGASAAALGLNDARTAGTWSRRDAAGRVAPASINGDRGVIGPVDRVGLVKIGPLSLLQAAQPSDSETLPREGASAGEYKSAAVPFTVAINLCDRDRGAGLVGADRATDDCGGDRPQ